jgi:probable HAF family extracellular repeat protein
MRKQGHSDDPDGARSRSVRIESAAPRRGPGSRKALLGVNSTGQAVGQSSTAGVESHAFLWDSVNGMLDLGALSGTFARSQAQGINTWGQVVGFTTTPSDATHAFIAY